ncbi:hypothetical protein A2415_01840 [candidate division WWE3 bacterium RIFOXYC1_FULL_39_7]|uniref:Glycosyltransferase 2-like domain-containing protein n=1 Tax=candidate division WWE3 bacterium RIFOXYC1_FULL_39_7 TaxID=1802643 RepID=A0A1F4WFV7_UNCKA|nr:MAG: hypothetical protein A2415_01840 [candidate division WWE3 bacterium RIFOXYC1_FULL_39_7]
MQKSSSRRKLLSVVVPAYRKERTIKKDLELINETLRDGLPGEYDFEIICVVDGKLDATEDEAKKVKSDKVKILSYSENRGKGYAVRYGMKEARGDLISFLDAGLEISPKGIMMLVAHMDWYEADIVVGSKRHPVSRVNYPFKRKVFSVGYHLVTKLMFGLSLRDTQSGIKIFKREVVDAILPRLLVKRYAMDIEMLAVAKHLGFDRIYEAPIEVHFDKSTTTIDWKTIFKMAWDTTAVYYRLRILHYYDKKNEKEWGKYR